MLEREWEEGEGKRGRGEEERDKRAAGRDRGESGRVEERGGGRGRAIATCQIRHKAKGQLSCYCANKCCGGD